MPDPPSPPNEERELDDAEVLFRCAALGALYGLVCFGWAYEQGLSAARAVVWPAGAGALVAWVCGRKRFPLGAGCLALWASWCLALLLLDAPTQGAAGVEELPGLLRHGATVDAFALTLQASCLTLAVGAVLAAGVGINAGAALIALVFGLAFQTLWTFEQPGASKVPLAWSLSAVAVAALAPLLGVGPARLHVDPRPRGLLRRLLLVVTAACLAMPVFVGGVKSALAALQRWDRERWLARARAQDARELRRLGPVLSDYLRGCAARLARDDAPLGIAPWRLQPEEAAALASLDPSQLWADNVGDPDYAQQARIQSVASLARKSSSVYAREAFGWLLSLPLKRDGAGWEPRDLEALPGYLSAELFAELPPELVGLHDVLRTRFKVYLAEARFVLAEIGRTGPHGSCESVEVRAGLSERISCRRRRRGPRSGPPKNGKRRPDLTIPAQLAAAPPRACRARLELLSGLLELSGGSPPAQVLATLQRAAASGEPLAELPVACGAEASEALRPYARFHRGELDCEALLEAAPPLQAHVHIALRAARQGDDDHARRHLLAVRTLRAKGEVILPASDPHVLLAERARHARPPLGRPAPLAGVAPLGSCSLGRK